jgi:hypothetical protein
VLPPKILDENLRQYATEHQWNTYVAYCELGSLVAVSEHMGGSQQNVGQNLRCMLRRAAAAGYMPVPEFETFAKSILTGQYGEERAVWDKQRLKATDPDDAEQMPQPKILTSLSTMQRGNGEVIVQWKREDIEKQAQLALFEQHVNALVERVPVREVIDAPLGISYTDLLACYPIGDQHHGMAAWANECGKDWDLKISEKMIKTASQHLIDQCPPCEHAIIPFAGDFFHYDSYKPVTPAHAHLLDADSRFPKMIKTGWMITEHLIEAAARKHQNVHVMWAGGNHDEASAATTRAFLARLYRDNPRITVDESDAFWHYYQFGKVMIGLNHGDKVKPARQLSVVAAERPVMWGETTYRIVFLGHRHHEERVEYNGGIVETLAVLPPPDAYAHRGGYRSAQKQLAVVFNRNGWEQSRHYFYPDMVEAK